MREKDLKKRRQYIKKLIQGQMKIWKLNGRKNGEVTISLPKVTDDDEATGDDKVLVLDILEELKYDVVEISFQVVNSTMLITVLVK